MRYLTPTTVTSAQFLLPICSIRQEERLLELAQQYLSPAHWDRRLKTMTQERTDWTAIGRELDRVPKDCFVKYKSIQNSKFKKGRFTAQEDALICQRVDEWGDKGNGLWAALEKEMGRVANNIRQRWGDVLSKKQQSRKEGEE